MRSSILTALVIAGELSLMTHASIAQQASRSGAVSPARRSYFGRVQTQPQAGAITRATGSRFRSGLELTRSLDPSGVDPNPLRPYGSDRRAAVAPRPYERAPVISPPEREVPAPVVSHNYFPGLRASQGPNANRVVGPLCVPGRRAFLHR